MPCVTLENGCLNINGKPEVLLCSSFFYFRIPGEYWRRRMRDLKKSGYNAIDVYFPWNYHETAPGTWDFSGEKDVAAFLTIAKEEQLYVVARPGPYICSEWDGGGIPIWVHQASENVRQFDRQYLSLFEQWMSRILPVIHRFELGRDGSIVLLQLENELDLFPCRHAHRYMEAIRDMADGFDVGVPYVACVAGKGDVDAATGMVERIAPAFNIYPPFSDPSVEEKMEILQKQILQPRGLPLLATETEREHNFMRRELASGVRLISPYCQTATTNFDCRNGVCSWRGTPDKRIVFITNDYDMDAMLKADGAVTQEFLEARLLANLIRTLGARVAGGRPFADHDITVNADFQTNDEGVHAMALQGGGTLLCLPNLSRSAGTATVTKAGVSFQAKVSGDTTALLLFNVSLADWGHPSATLLWSALDIAWIDDKELVAYGDGTGIALEISGKPFVCHGGETFEVDGHTLTVRVLAREEAARSASPFLPAFRQPVLPPWQSQHAAVEAASADVFPAPEGDKPICAMENMDAYDGRTAYRFHLPACKALLLKNASNLAALWVDGKHVRSWISNGGMQRVAVSGGEAELRTEIWGHTCFDEAYNPVLFMKSLRGLEGAYAVLQEKDIHNNWHFTPDKGEFDPYVTPLWSALPCITAFGSLIPRGATYNGMFRKELTLPMAGDTRILHFADLTMRAAVYVNGRLAGEVDRSDPYVDISAVTQPGTSAELIVRVRTDDCNATAGAVTLLTCESIKTAAISHRSVGKLIGQAAAKGDAPVLPLTLRGGEAQWLRLSVKPEEQELWLRPEGQEIMTTIVHHGHVLGRLMPNAQVDCHFRAGDPLRVWMPQEWLKQDGSVYVLVEALSDAARLDGFMLDKR